MKFKYFSILCALAMCASCGNNATHEDGHEHESEHHDHETEEAHQHEGHDEHGSHKHSSDEIVFEHAKAEKFGVKTTVISPSAFHKVFKVSGEIISASGDTYTVSAPSAGIVKFSHNISQGIKVNAGAIICSISAKDMVGGDSNQNAKITYIAAKREFERIEPLYREKIVTESEYIAARENYEKAKIAYLSSSGNGSTAKTAISGTVTSVTVTDGSYVEAGTVIATVSKNARLQLHADLPQRFYNQAASITTANFTTAYSDEVISLSSLNGKKISGNNIVASNGYIPVVFEFDNNNTLASGTYADVYLIGNSTGNTIVLPVKALTEELNSFYVYAKLDEDCYEKRLVEIGANDGDNVEIFSGVKNGDEIVTEGAVFVKLAANSGAIPEGHSHNH